jgi:hydroxymethylbilane synthase
MAQSLIIGTRGSKLALVQAEYIAAELRRHHPGCTVEIQIISTQGDRVLDVALSKVGDKGLFVKEIEVALLEGRIDLAVHSGKDLPSQVTEGLTLAAFPRRVDPRDALVLPQRAAANGAAHGTDQVTTALEMLPRGAIVGTSSLRRACQLRALRPDLDLRDVRGNVDTRLRKLDEGQYDALVLASAGLTRLGLHERISYYLPPDVMLPAVAQGALAIEARSDDTATLEALAVLDDHATRLAVLAERACLRRLEGGCQVPIAAHTTVEQDAGRLTVRGLVGALDGSRMVHSAYAGTFNDPEQAGLALAEDLLRQGAGTLLEEQRAHEDMPTNLGAPLPLHGWRVVVTRAADQATEMSEQVRRRGAEAVYYPTIAYAPPEEPEPLDAALRELLGGGYHWLLLTSAAGVRAVAERLRALNGGTVPQLSAALQVGVVGPATAVACVDLLGVQPAVMPDEYVAEALATTLGNIAGQRVLLAQANLARPVLAEQLRQAGARVDAVVAYCTVLASDGADVPALLAAGEVHAITFTSGSTVRNFAQRVGPQGINHARRVVIACIGPVTAEAAREVGLTPTLVADDSTVEGLLDALVNWRREQATAHA